MTKHYFSSINNSPLTTLIFLTTFLSGCATYGDKVAPVPLPSAQTDKVIVQGATLIARPYVDRKQAKAAFGFDIRDAGLLPIRFVIDNQSTSDIQINPKQTFLIDQQGQAWPLLTSEQAYQRVKGKVELGETALGAAKPAVLMGAAGAIAGFAIGILSGENVGKSTAKGAVLGASVGALYGGAEKHASMDKSIRQDLGKKSLRNRRIRPGELAYGYLFFPGKEEASSAKALRLSIKIHDIQQIVTVPF